MLKKGLFKRPKNRLEGINNTGGKAAKLPDKICLSCPSCKKMQLSGDLSENLHICGFCGYYFRLSAKERIEMTSDKNTFCELFSGIKSTNILEFPGYDEKLAIAAEESGEEEAVICGTCNIKGIKTCLFAMEPYFMMGSMGTAVGEKITRLFEYALEESLPVIGYCVSGGARMQEGILSLMQMAKTSAAVKRHNDKGNLYISVLTDPTTGGVTASFAMEGDIIISEPQALICFAGPRVIEQTIKQKLPVGFQKAEFLLSKGFIDKIAERKNLKDLLYKFLMLHTEVV